MAAVMRAIAIDGPSGAGKSTVARQVAVTLNFLYVDTGAMYRALTWQALRLGVDVQDEAAVGAMAADCRVQLADKAGKTLVLLNGEDVSDAIREPDVTANVSAVCSYGAVRRAMVAQQRLLAAEQPVVMDGRDIGTYVLQNALLKIFLTAEPAVRAHRRYLEWQARGVAMSEAEVLADLERRDRLDSTRALQPLRQAEDALLLDTTGLAIPEVADRIIELWRERDV